MVDLRPVMEVQRTIKEGRYLGLENRDVQVSLACGECLRQRRSAGFEKRAKLGAPVQVIMILVCWILV